MHLLRESVLCISFGRAFYASLYIYLIRFNKMTDDMNKQKYYILNCTWGIIMTLIGAIAALALLFLGHRPTRHGGCFCFEVGENWGAISLGLVIICSSGSSNKTKNHEFGHSIQNARWGFLFPIVIGLHSFVRCQYYNYLYKHDFEKYKALPDYDSIWFEGEASALGDKYITEWDK